MKLVAIIPCYNEEESIPLFIAEMEQYGDTLLVDYGLDVEYLFIDDGSSDKTLEILYQKSQEIDKVHYISFSRNFGKEAALYAGLKEAAPKADLVVTMDVDLQDPPCLLPDMVNAVLNEEYDSVATRRVNRKGEPIIRSWFARKFYKIINRISDADIVDGARDYRLMNKKFVEAVLSIKEYNRFSKGIYGWVGFKTKWLEYENTERVAGETKWSFWKLFKYALDGIVAFSIFPLQIASMFGILLFVVSVVFIIFILIRTIAFGDPVSGWPSLACIITFVGGVQLLTIGVLGQYLGKNYLESKERPIYIVDRKN